MRRLAPLALVCAALATGCGGDDEEGQPRRPVSVPPGSDLRVKADEYRFDPARVDVENRAGRALEIVLDNEGSLAHNLKVLGGDRELGGTPAFPGGETRSAKVRLPRGRYRFVCTVGNHEELGMKGELVVR